MIVHVKQESDAQRCTAHRGRPFVGRIVRVQPIEKKKGRFEYNDGPAGSQRPADEGSRFGAGSWGLKERAEESMVRGRRGRRSRRMLQAAASARS